MVGFEVPAGSYWVQIEGENGEEGDFELLVLCDDHSALHPTAIPTPVPPVPTMEPTWDCASRVYTDVSNSSSNVSCATYVDNVLASNNTFDCRGLVTCHCPNNVTAPPQNCSNETEIVYQTVYKNVYVCEDEVFVPSGEPPCAFKHLTCNDVEFDSNAGAPNEIGEEVSL